MKIIAHVKARLSVGGFHSEGVIRNVFENRVLRRYFGVRGTGDNYITRTFMMCSPPHQILKNECNGIHTGV